MRFCTLTILSLSLACAADGVRNLPIINGSMTEGTDTCTGWDQRWTGSGTLTASRDKTVFKGAPASLCLATVGEAKGNVFQRIEVAAGSTISLSGWLKTEGTVKVQVFVQVFDQDWKPVDYQMLKNQWAPAPEWTEFTGNVTLPANAVRVGVGIAVDGNGKAWLDEVRNTADKKAK